MTAEDSKVLRNLGKYIYLAMEERQALISINKTWNVLTCYQCYQELTVCPNCTCDNMYNVLLRLVKCLLPINELELWTATMVVFQWSGGFNFKSSL